MTLHARVTQASANGLDAVARELALDGAAFDARLGRELTQRFSTFPSGSLFSKCIVEAAQWAGFVDDSDWEADAMRYLESQPVFIKQKYRSGFHAAKPIAYLDTWAAIIGDPRIPNPPDANASARQVHRFFNEAFAKLNDLEWRRERAQVGPWTFYGAFKIFLVHETHLWSDPTIDAIRLPMGGEPHGYSFERGWTLLEQLSIVPPIGSASGFTDGLRRADQVHAEVTKLAGLAGTRSLHINSGIYCIGSP